MQLYRGMDVGTAKVTPEEMDGVPHHMIDVAEPWESFSAARYVEMADPILQDILSRGKTAIIAGGTGLYVDALIAGRTFAPYPETGRRQALEQEAEELGMEHMLSRLRAVDPDSASRLHLADRKRIIRALEVYEETGKTITQHNLETQTLPDKYHPVWIGLTYEPRQLLYDRIDLRWTKCWRRDCWRRFGACWSGAFPADALPCRPLDIRNSFLSWMAPHPWRRRWSR